MSRSVVLVSTILALLAGAPAVEAQTLRIKDNVTQGKLVSGNVEAVVTNRKTQGMAGSFVYQPMVQIFANGKPVGILIGKKSTFPLALAQIAELDPTNKYPEVLLSSYSGGAHCCNYIQVLTSYKSAQAWRVVKLGPFDGGPTEATDPLKNGRYILELRDNRFLSRFTPYVGSAAPLRFWMLNALTFNDISHRTEFKPLYLQSLQADKDWFLEKKHLYSNGFLAAYVASKSMVGELKDGWQQMLKRYDRQSDIGLSFCIAGFDNNGKCRRPPMTYNSFPEALRAFLIDTGYIKSSDI